MSNPRVEEIRARVVGSPFSEPSRADVVLLLTKLDEAQERERVLLVGIAQARDLALTPSTTGGMMTTLQAKVAAILSSTDTAERIDR